MMADVNWRRVFAVSFLVVALILVAGSIYLHVQQKHHFGRLRHEHSHGSRTESGSSEVDELAVAAIVGDTELTAAVGTSKSDPPTIILYHWESAEENSEENRLYSDLLGAIKKLKNVFLPSSEQHKSNVTFYADTLVEGSTDDLYRKMTTEPEEAVASGSEQSNEDYQDYDSNDDYGLNYE